MSAGEERPVSAAGSPDSIATAPRRPFGGLPMRILRIAITVGLVAIVVRVANVSDALATLAGASIAWVVLALCLALADRAVMIAKWFPLLTVQLPAVTIAPVIRATLASNVAALVLPTTVGSDVLRAVAVGRRAGRITEVGASIVMERLLGLLASAMFTSLAVVLAWRAGVSFGVLLPIAAMVLGVSLAVTLLPFLSASRPDSRLARLTASLVRRRWLDRFGRFAAAYTAYRRHPRRLAGVMFLTLIEQLFPILVFYCAARAIGVELAPVILLVVVPLSLFLARLPISVSGIGVMEGSIVYLLGLFAVPPADALALALLARLTGSIALLPGVLFWGDLSGTRACVRPVPVEPLSVVDVRS